MPDIFRMSLDSYRVIRTLKNGVQEVEIGGKRMFSLDAGSVIVGGQRATRESTPLSSLNPGYCRQKRKRDDLGD